MNDFVQIPKYSNYGISSDGTVTNLKRNRLVPGSRNPTGYFNFRITDDDGHVVTWGRHRLLCYVFKYRPDYEELQVNHINGIKGDDRLENLEWTTPRENTEHAGMTGLSPKCKPVAVRDVLTGDISVYPSVTACGESLGFTKDAILYRVHAGEERVFPEMKQYRFGLDGTNWKVPTDFRKALSLNGTSKGIVVRYVLTGECYQFIRLSDLAKHLNVSSSLISKWVKLPSQPVLPGFIQLKWGYDNSPWREIGDPYLELSRTTNKRPVQTINDRTNEVRTFISAAECGRVMGIKPTALDHRLKTNGSKVYTDGFRYRYYTYNDSPTNQ